MEMALQLGTCLSHDYVRSTQQGPSECLLCESISVAPGPHPPGGPPIPSVESKPLLFLPSQVWAIQALPQIPRPGSMALEASPALAYNQRGGKPGSLAGPSPFPSRGPIQVVFQMRVSGNHPTLTAPEMCPGSSKTLNILFQFTVITS